MVKTRKNQKKQRGGFFGFFTKPEPQPSCSADIEKYMTNEFNNDVTISSLQDNISKIDTCMGSNDIDNNDKQKLGGYSIEINKKLADKQAQYAKIADAEASAARKKHEQHLWNQKEAKLREDLAKRNAAETQKQPTSTGGNRKSKRKSRKSRKSIKKSKNNKR